MEKNPIVIWALRVLAIAVMAAFFIPMYGVKYNVLGVTTWDIDIVSFLKIATGEGKAMAQLANITHERTLAYPILFIFLLIPACAIVFSFIPKLKSVAKYVYVAGFIANFVLFITLFIALFDSIPNVIFLPNGWFTASYFLSFAGFILSTSCILYFVVQKIKELSN